MKYISTVHKVTAVTFRELVEHGCKSGANIVRGMPWSFSFEGFPVSHANDECYLITTPTSTLRLCPMGMLVVDAGRAYVCMAKDFLANHAVDFSEKE